MLTRRPFRPNAPVLSGLWVLKAPWVLLHNPKRTEPGWGCGEGFVSSPGGFVGPPFVALLGAASSAPVAHLLALGKKGASPNQTEGRGCRHGSAQPQLTDLAHPWAPDASWCGTWGRNWAETQTGARGSPEDRSTSPGRRQGSERLQVAQVKASLCCGPQTSNRRAN